MHLGPLHQPRSHSSGPEQGTDRQHPPHEDKTPQPQCIPPAQAGTRYLKNRKTTLKVTGSQSGFPLPGHLTQHPEEKQSGEKVPALATCSISQEPAGPAAQSRSAGPRAQVVKAIASGANRGARGAGYRSPPHRAAAGAGPAAASLQEMLSRAGAAV